MYRRFIYPNVGQGAVNLPALVEAPQEADLPRVLTRLGIKKLDYLIRGVAQVRQSQRVLELFGGTCFSTACLARCTKRITSVDLCYDFSPWRYVVNRNFALASWSLDTDSEPNFVAADARSLPFPPNGFDVVLAPDSPRTVTAYTDEQRDLFMAAAKEARRVLKPGGIFAATAPEDWTKELDFSEIRVINDNALSEGVRFRQCNNCIRYIRCVA